MPQRSFNVATDRDLVLALVLAARSAGGGDHRPSYTRMRTLLGWRLWSPSRDARVWADGGGSVVGFAGLFPPDPHGDYLPLLCVVHPQEVGRVDASMLEWAVTRAHEIAAERGKAVTLYLTTPAGDRDASPQHGFVRQEVTIVHMARTLAKLPAAPVMPHGFALRSMPPPAELASYLAPYGPLFGRRSLEARVRLMAHPDYDPALELVAVDEEGTLAAFCESSLSRTEWCATGRRAGEIDMLVTHPDARRRGLGRALLLAALHRLRDRGAATATLFTESTNTSARQLYVALGFTISGESIQYTRVVAPQ